MSWKRRFDDAIVLPDGRKLVTLLDAATYATKLSKKEADTAEWQAAIERSCWWLDGNERRSMAGPYSSV